MPITIGHAASHGFDQPIGLLSDCHRRVELFLGAMQSVAGAEQGRELAPASRGALEQASRYFTLAGPRHTADEEQSLFPRLRLLGDPRVTACLATMETLEADHRQAETWHAVVQSLVQTWLTAGALSADDAAVLVASLASLRTLYTRHIAIEDHELFPIAGEVLSPDDLESIGREMAGRRGVPFRPPGFQGPTPA
jgi:hemerythrin-like domain-containing protein